MNPIQFEDAIIPMDSVAKEETLVELSDMIYELRQIEIGKRMHDCIMWREKDNAAFTNDGNYDCQVLRDIVSNHDHTFPVHPLCIRRAYYVLELNNDDITSKFKLIEVDKSVGDNVVASGSFDLDALRTGKPIDLMYKSYVGEDIIALDIARKGILCELDATPCKINNLYVQNWYQIIREGDWGHLDKEAYTLEEYDEHDGLHYMETVFCIGRWIDDVRVKAPQYSIYNYREVTRYPQY